MLVTSRYGNFEIPHEKDLIASSLRLYGEWAQLEINTLANFIEGGSSVVDVGAFIGTHARAFSTIVGENGKVYAFEPNSSIYSFLEQNAKKSPYDNVITFPFALDSIERKMSIVNKLSDSNQGATCLEACSKNSENPIEVRPLDSFNIEAVDFIKADVEGMELAVLMGGDETINRYNPIVFLEVNSLQASAGILEWARDRNYLSYGLISGAFNPFNFNRAKKNIFGQAKECGLLLIPKDNVGKFADKIEHLKLAEIRTIDDLALLLLHKFQYAYEVLAQSVAASTLGIGYSSHEQRKTWCFKLQRRLNEWIMLLKRGP